MDIPPAGSPPMARLKIITALGTPLQNERDELCRDGLAAHLDDQADAGIDGLLVGGTMGALQLLPDRTYQDLVRGSSELNRGRFELLVGITDHGLHRALDRARFVESVGGVDGLVALTPSGFGLSEPERADFYRHLADATRLPLFIYELAPATGVAFGVSTLAELSRHPNIAGIKISANLPKARAVRERLDASFRVIPAEPQLLDHCAVTGPWSEHLDGVWAATPHWAMAIATLAARGDHAAASGVQRRLNGLLQRWIDSGQIMAAFTATMNARGIPGRYHPRPLRDLPDAARRALLESPEVVELLRDHPVTAAMAT